MSAHGLYIHIPFCRGKCLYCDFYSLPGSAEAMNAYAGAVCRAIKTHPFGHLTVDSVYFGGGTPSSLGAFRLGRILDTVLNTFSVPSNSEITLEANPGTLDDGELTALRHSGFSRISFGIQSLQPGELAALGRRHTAKQATDAAEAAHQAGFSHISADVMLGIPHQTRESLAATLSVLCTLPIDHVSAYLLKIEEGTPFARSGAEALCPGEDRTAQLYLDCVEALESHGLHQYEISNFSHPGAESRHNLKYWLCEPYLGIGPAAHSFVGGKRFFFPRDLDAFLGAKDPFSLLEQDGEGGGFEEYAMLRLRLREGLDLTEAQSRYGIDPAPILARARPLAERGVLYIASDVISLTPEGFLLSNAVTGALLF